jgi:hypothetical protein
MRFISGVALADTGYHPDGPFKDYQWIAKIFVNEQAVLSVLLILCYLRGLKLLRIPPFTGPVTQSIMDVSILLYQ